MVIPDTAQKRANYEEQVIRTFYVSHADATELAQMINTIIRVPAMAVQPMIAPNKTNNTITIRATTAVAAIIEKMIEANDKPRAEIVIDVQILEINRGRAKTFGLDLSNYQINAVFSPEADPRGTNGGRRRGDRPRSNTRPPFNLNTITRGISTADFYLAVPSAIVRFLETDSETKLIAKPQLRGAEGQKITLNLGDDIPVPSTVFTPLATGGANTNPLTSFNYRTVGIIVEMTPRVTIEGDVILDLSSRTARVGATSTSRGRTFRRSARARSPRGCGCATASRTCWPGCFARTIGERCAACPASSRFRCSTSCSRRTTPRSGPDRHRDAADAAHRADAGDHGGRSQSDLHRHAAEPRPQRTAAAHRTVHPSRRRRSRPAGPRCPADRARAGADRPRFRQAPVPAAPAYRLLPRRQLADSGAAPAAAAATPRLRLRRRVQPRVRRRSPPPVRRLS